MDKRKEIIKYRFADPQRTYNICCELLEQGKQSGNDYEIAYAYHYMGDACFSLGEVDEALKYLMMSEKVQKHNGFDELRMRTYNIIGVIYSNIGDALLSLDYYQAAMELARKYNDTELQGMIYNNVGVLLTNAGDHANATQYYEKAYEYFNCEGDEDNEPACGMFRLYMNVAEGMRIEKRYANEKAYLDEVMKIINTDTLVPMDKIKLVHAYGMLYYETGEYEKAFDMCVKAVALCENNMNDIDSFDDYRDIVELLINMDKIGHIQGILECLSDMAEKSDIDKRRIQVCRFRIQIYEKTGEKEKYAEQLRIYYQLRKRINAERNDIIISAIDNRCRLEDERKENKRLNEDNLKLIRESEIDELTGIYNRLAFRRRYDRMYKYALRNAHTYCMGILDIDFFKVYNDSYGHIRGDKCIKQIAAILMHTSDGDFCVARYGGDEFVFMAYDVSEEKVRDFLQRLIENVRNAAIAFDAKPCGTDKVTISVGAVIQQQAEEGTTLTDLLKLADKVLYEVKQAGKDGYKIMTKKIAGLNNNI